MITPLPAQVWQHYKGGTYEVISCAQHTERDEILVVYRSVAFGTVYARPLSIWYDQIEVPGSKKKVQRFTQIINSEYDEVD
jgi:hypothetical protein